MIERARRYQKQLDDRVKAALAAGTKPLVVLPTGGGKTFCARMRARETRRPMGIVPTKVLRDQANEEIPELLETFIIDGLLSNGPRGAARRDKLRTATLGWVDEAHRILAPESKTLRDVVAELACFGSTATPQRADGTPLSEFWDTLLVGASYSELLALNHLCPCDVAEPEMRRQDQKKNKVRDDGVKTYLRMCQRADGTWRPGIHTATTVSECQEAVDRYRSNGIRAELVCCETGDDDRRRTFDLYSAGHLDMLASPMALSEGFDSPRAEVLVSCRAFAHVGTYLQWCGRILRPYDQRVIEKWTERLRRKGIEMQPAALVPKRRALLIDTTDAARVHGSPTKDRVYSLDGAGIKATPDPEEKEAIEREEVEREESRRIEMQYRIIRDTVVEHYLTLEEQARERGYAPGWVYYRMKDLGLDPPRAFEARYKSVCKHCRKRVRSRTCEAPGQQIFWAGRGLVYHQDCWFASLTEAELRPAYDALRG